MQQNKGSFLCPLLTPHIDHIVAGRCRPGPHPALLNAGVPREWSEVLYEYTLCRDPILSMRFPVGFMQIQPTNGREEEGNVVVVVEPVADLISPISVTLVSRFNQEKRRRRWKYSGLAIANLPVEGEDAEGELPEAVVLAEHDADGAAEVLVPARHRGAERDRRPHPPRRHRPEHVLRPHLAARHREVRLRATRSYQ